MYVFTMSTRVGLLTTIRNKTNILKTYINL